MLSRRRFVQGMAGSLALSLASRSRADAPPKGKGSGPKPAAPHYVVNILLAGGIDAVLSIDPKSHADAPGVDAGYRSDERIRGRERMYGPLIGSLLRLDEEMCLVHGVRVDSVSHPEGHLIVSRGRITSARSTPVIGDVLGAALPGGAPIEHLCLADSAMPLLPMVARGYLSTAVSLPPTFLKPRFAPGFVMPPRSTWSARLLRDKMESARKVFARDPAQLAEYERAQLQTDGLAQLLHTLPTATAFKDDQLGYKLETAFQAIQHNNARFITVASDYLWFDSHTENLALQKRRLPTAFDDIAVFVERLKAARNEHGSLMDETTLVIGSEIGRFPRLNAAAGKDHWPENSWILMGRGIKRQPGGLTVGATGPDYRGMAIDFDSGTATGEKRLPIFVDSIFATLMQIAQVPLTANGYRSDQVLRCVLG